MFNSYRTDVETALRGVPGGQVENAVSVLKYVKRAGGAVYIMGNGGSAATASHFANDLVKVCGLRAFSLPDMVPLLTAYGNDNEWEDMFDLTIRSFLSPHDAVIGISCSGKSANVLRAMTSVKENNGAQDPGYIRTIGLTGDDLESPLAKMDLDVLISVPFRDIRVQEDCHMVICHAIVGALK